MTSRSPYRRSLTSFQSQPFEGSRAVVIRHGDAQCSHNNYANIIQLWLGRFNRGEITDEEVEARVIAEQFALNNDDLRDFGLDKVSSSRRDLQSFVLCKGKPCIFGSALKRGPRPPQQDDLLRPRLVDWIGPRHEPVTLAALID